MKGQSQSSEPALSTPIGSKGRQTAEELSVSAVSSGWLQHRDVRKYLQCHQIG